MDEVQRRNTNEQLFAVIGRIPGGVDRQTVISRVSLIAQLHFFNIVVITSSNNSYSTRIGIGIVKDIDSVFSLTSHILAIGGKQTIQFSMIPDQSNLVKRAVYSGIILSLSYESNRTSTLHHIERYFESLCPQTRIMTVKRDADHHTVTMRVLSSFSFPQYDIHGDALCIDGCRIHYRFTEEEYLDSYFPQEKSFIDRLRFECIDIKYRRESVGSNGSVGMMDTSSNMIDDDITFNQKDLLQTIDSSIMEDDQLSTIFNDGRNNELVSDTDTSSYYDYQSIIWIDQHVIEGGTNNSQSILSRIAVHAEDIDQLNSVYMPKIREVWDRLIRIRDQLKKEKGERDILTNGMGSLKKTRTSKQACSKSSGNSYTPTMYTKK